MMPLYDIATMDGYAVSSADKPPIKIVGEIFPDTPIKKIDRGQAYYITTGSPLPEGANAVVKIEEAEVVEDRLYYSDVTAGRYVLKRGDDFKENELVIEVGRRISTQEVAMLAALGKEEVKVLKNIKWELLPPEMK